MYLPRVRAKVGVAGKIFTTRLRTRLFKPYHIYFPSATPGLDVAAAVAARVLFNGLYHCDGIIFLN